LPLANVVEVELRAELMEEVATSAFRRNFAVFKQSCGACGKDSIAEFSCASVPLTWTNCVFPPSPL